MGQYVADSCRLPVNRPTESVFQTLQADEDSKTTSLGLEAEALKQATLHSCHVMSYVYNVYIYMYIYIYTYANVYTLHVNRYTYI